MNNKMLHKVAFILVIVGGLNWLLEAFGFGIGNFIPGVVAMILYVVIGLAAIYEVVTHKSSCRACGGGAAPAAPQGGGATTHE